jgi:Domain of unknown function (DUF4276)
VSRVHFLVEGQTEEAVVRDVIQPFLQAHGLWLTSSILTTKRAASGRKFRGGVSAWSAIKKDVDLLLRDTSIDVLTTMIDYYGVPTDTPGMADRPPAGPEERVSHVEEAIAAAVASPRFRPHLTLHETEAWVFAATDELADRFGNPSLGTRAAQIVGSAGGPEWVNDGPTTAPSKRLLQLCADYTKVVDGPAVLADAGLEPIFDQCPHARRWLHSLID